MTEAAEPVAAAGPKMEDAQDATLTTGTTGTTMETADATLGGEMDCSTSPKSCSWEDAGEEDPEEVPVDREGSLVDEYFPGHVEVDQKSGVAGLSHRSDRFRGLSVQGRELDSLPLMLVVFVCILAALLGLVVAGLHSMVKYVGCPLGINGCNSFSGTKYDSSSFVLIKALDELPEDVVYVLMAILSLLVIGVIVDLAPESYAKQALGGGTVQSLLAVAAGIPISFGCALLRVIVTAIYFVGGGTMGGDGPTIQVCTALAGMIGWICGIRSPRTQSLLASLGFCCGFAASFNAPLAGILFAMEELQHVSSRLTTRVICIILIGSIISTGVMRGFLGNKVLFKVNFHPGLSDLVSGASTENLFGENFWLLISIPIGIMSACVGYLFHLCFHYLHRFLKKVAFRFCPRFLVFALLAGLSAAIGSLVFRITGLRGVWGVGVQSLSIVLNAEVQQNDALIFAIGKLSAFAVGVAARFPGDTLEPVLISGGFLGAWVGQWLPMEESRSACEIFGMVSLFASCFRFPLTPVLIVLELTGTDSYYLILLVALSSFTALFISNHLFPPILEQILEQDGIDLEAVAELAETADEEEAVLKAEMERERQNTEDSQSDLKRSHCSAQSIDSRSSRAFPSAFQAALEKLEHKLEESLAEVSAVDRGRRRMSRISLASSLRSFGAGSGLRSPRRTSRRSDESSLRSLRMRENSSLQSDSLERTTATGPRPVPRSSQRSSRLSHSSSRSFGGCASSGTGGVESGENPDSHAESRPVVTFDEGEDAIGVGESWRV